MYYKAHPKLKWISTTTAGVPGVAGKIVVYANGVSSSGGWNLLTRHNFGTFQQIGQIWVTPAGGIDTYSYYYDGQYVQYANGNVDVLVCQ